MTENQLSLTVKPWSLAYCTKSFCQAAMRRLLDQRRDFDGVMCLSDIIAVGVMRALQERSIAVPGEVAVMGFDGIVEASYIHPALSTVSIDRKGVARACLDFLIERIESARGYGAAHGDGGLLADRRRNHPGLSAQGDCR